LSFVFTFESMLKSLVGCFYIQKHCQKYRQIGLYQQTQKSLNTFKFYGCVLQVMQYFQIIISYKVEILISISYFYGNSPFSLSIFKFWRSQTRFGMARSWLWLTDSIFIDWQKTILSGKSVKRLWSAYNSYKL